MTAISSTNPDKHEDDLALVDAAQAGDLYAYNELVTRYQGRIYGLVYNMTSNREDAEDLVQEIFVKAYKALGRFNKKASFFTWIYRISVNQTINFLKKRKRRSALSLNDMDQAVERNPIYVELSSRNSPLRDAKLAEIQERLNKALLSLSEKHRTIVVLHDIQGIAHEEISKMLGCSSGTVRSRLHYARQQLQNELADLIA